MRAGTQPDPIFRLSSPFSDPVRTAAFTAVAPPIERMFALDRLREGYESIRRTNGDRDWPFLDRAVAHFGIRWHVPEADLQRIPNTGPVVVVANHPFGAVEGIVLAQILRAVRPDARILANSLLGRIPELRDLFLFVDPFGAASSNRASFRGLRAACSLLAGGGMVAMFPAGEVAHFDVRLGVVTDARWDISAARLARSAGASVLPVFFSGHNGLAFQAAGLVHPLMRTALLPRAFLRSCREPIELRIGAPIQHAHIATLGDDHELTAHLRERTYLLRRSITPRRATEARTSTSARPFQRQTPTVPATCPDLLRAEIAALPGAQFLLHSGEHLVFWARSAQIPSVLYEIGRLREVTFRGVGEGTGKPLDLDRFDQHYLHLAVWNQETSEVVGAYRLGPTDTIRAARGISGLYTSTLFRFRPGAFDRFSPALEMGRSFVRPEYQRSFAPLLLLWKGIGAFVAASPRYRYLFGPVSISNAYTSTSRELMVRYLREHAAFPGGTRDVRPRHPLKLRASRDVDVARFFRSLRSPEQLSDLVAELETDGKGLPVLLRQYLKLGGRVIEFNVDHEFSEVVDGLIVVDLLATDAKILERYLGREGATSFRRHHAVEETGGLPRAS